MVVYQYCVCDDCTWTAEYDGDSVNDGPGSAHMLAHPGHTVRGGTSALHTQLYYRQQNGGNVTEDAPTSEDWPLAHVAPGDVHGDLSEAEVAALAAELDSLREKVAEWSCDTEDCERLGVVTKGVDGPARCRECAGFTLGDAEEPAGETA